jgi:hypothetical protein
MARTKKSIKTRSKNAKATLKARRKIKRKKASLRARVGKPKRSRRNTRK